jgi:Tol biopolymer transport system component
MKIRFLLSLLLLSFIVFAQTTLAPLTVEKIMRDQKWIGTSPSNPYWSADGRYLFFSWNPDNAVSDSVYYITLGDRTPKKTTYEMRQNTPSLNSITYNNTKTSFAYTKEGDLFYVDAQKKERRITQTVESESSPQFIEGDTKIVFSRTQNLFAWDIATGLTMQLTNFVRGMAPRDVIPNAQKSGYSKML